MVRPTDQTTAIEKITGYRAQEEGAVYHTDSRVGPEAEGAREKCGQSMLGRMFNC
jgi:hypothetical protein